MGMVIGICGYGYTGSGAIIDFLKGYKSLTVLDDFEFSFVYTPDGIEDLYYHLVECPTRYMSSDIAISRFKLYVNGKNSEIEHSTRGAYLNASNEFIDSLIQVKWLGYWMFDYFEAGFWKKNIAFRLIHNRIFKLLSKFSNKTYDIPPMRDMYMSVNPDDFVAKAKKYISAIIESMNKENGSNIILNQPFPANDPSRAFKYFDDPRAIIVDRDPRDLYVLLKKVITTKCRFIPFENVNSFIEYYRALHRCSTEKEDNVLHIQFEDMMYEFEATKKRIEQFLGIQDDFDDSISKFQPMVSIENTRLYNNYPDLKTDIQKIESELSEWLYDFDGKKVQPSGGKSYNELLTLADK